MVTGLYKWWSQDKISGTIMPVFIVLNINKIGTGDQYGQTDLIANASMLIIMIVSIIFYYKRNKLANELAEVTKKETTKIVSNAEVELAKIELERDVFEQRKSIEQFGMDVVEKQRSHQYSLITEQSDFITDQIKQKVEHIVYLAEYFEMGSEHVKKMVDTYKGQIEDLRKYQMKLPEKIEMRFKEFMVSTMPTVSPTEVTESSIIKEELSEVMDKVVEDAELTDTIDAISQT